MINKYVINVSEEQGFGFYNYLIYCNSTKDPLDDVLFNGKYQNYIDNVYDDMWNAFGEERCVIPENFYDWDEIDQDEWWDEQYDNFCNEVQFAIKDSWNEDEEGFDTVADDEEILIDERTK